MASLTSSSHPQLYLAIISLYAALKEGKEEGNGGEEEEEEED